MAAKRSAWNWWSLGQIDWPSFPISDVLQISWNSIVITSRCRICTSTEYSAQEYYFTVEQNISHPFVRSRNGHLPALKRHGADKFISHFLKQVNKYNSSLNKLYSPSGSAFDVFTLGFCLLFLFFLGFVLKKKSLKLLCTNNLAVN